MNQKQKNKLEKEKAFKNIGQNRKIAVGLSGGIDSAIALLLLKEQGWQPIGITLKLPVWNNKNNSPQENIASSQKSIKIARQICKEINVPYYVVDSQKEFREEVVKYFINEVKKYKTPNPCMVCNPHLKFFQLFTWAKKHRINYVATGHYARIKKDPQADKYQLLRAKDKAKDQSYYLAFLPKEWLPNIILPLGNYLKKEVIHLAEKERLKFLIRKKPSQDFCFLANQPLSSFLHNIFEEKPGLIKNSQGKILGRHKGLYFYTVGQRKGLNLSGGPYFVKVLDKKHNVLIVTKNKRELLKKIIFLSSVYFIGGRPNKKVIKIKTKVRYRQPLVQASLHLLSKNKAELIFLKPQEAISPGQFAVFYQEDICLGGGKIE